MTFVRVARALGTAFVCATVVAACSGSEDSSPVSDPTASESEPAQLETIGRFKVTVDPMAAEPVLVEPIEDEVPGPGTQNTPTLDPSRSVLTSVALTGRGPYDPVTQTVNAPIVMTHTGAISANFDEPQMVLTALSDTTGTVTFETSNNGNKGIGAVIAFADIQRPGAASVCAGVPTRTSASHALVIKDTVPATSFSFAVDVRAYQVTQNNLVSPDCDNDGKNKELEDAGGDCNDQNASVITGCDCSQCSTAGLSCDQTLTTGGAFSCNQGCSCNIAGDGKTDVNVTCQDDCNVQCDGATDGTDGGNIACRTACQQASACSLSCSNLVGDDCRMTCAGDSTCSLSCSDNTNAACEFQNCNGSTCSTTCEGNGTNCGVASCGNNSSCQVTCGTATDQANFSGRCGINGCGRDADCRVTCVNPGTQGCTLRCNSADAANCEMDCSAVPAASRNALCKVTCPPGETKTISPAGIVTCQ